MKNVNDLEYRIGTLEAFLDFDPKAPANEWEPLCIHDLIADAITDVTLDCGNQIAALQARLESLESNQPRNPA